MNSIKIKVFLRPLIISVVICFTTLPRSELTSSMVELATYDTFGRLTYFPNKRQIDCPRQTTSTGVLLVVGQSNSANHAHKIYQTQYPERVINYFNGKCFIGSSPLLGATGPNGNFITLLADNLILNSTFKTVVIVASGVSGSPISRWKFGRDLNRMLIATLSEAGSRYSITDIVWHQGENDFRDGTSAADYAASFQSFQRSLSENGVSAPIFIAIASKCLGSEWKASNPTANAQRGLIDGEKIFFGVDTDRLLEAKDRHDGCHFSESGQKKTADALAFSISSQRTSYKR